MRQLVLAFRPIPKSCHPDVERHLQHLLKKEDDSGASASGFHHGYQLSGIWETRIVC